MNIDQILLIIVMLHHMFIIQLQVFNNIKTIYNLYDN
jgi:hypothetical protein